MLLKLKGFHRYSVDSRWHVPHFEKMLYDQAQLLAIYAVYHAFTGQFAEVIEDIASYVDTNLTHKVFIFVISSFGKFEHIFWEGDGNRFYV